MAHAPERTMSAVLSNDIRQYGAGSEFVRQGDRFGLNPASKPPKDKTRHSAHLRAMFNGKAGEYSWSASCSSTASTRARST